MSKPDPYEPLSDEEREEFISEAHKPIPYEELERLVKAVDRLLCAFTCAFKDVKNEVRYTEQDESDALGELEKAIDESDVLAAIMALKADEFLTSTEAAEGEFNESSPDLDPQ